MKYVITWVEDGEQRFKVCKDIDMVERYLSKNKHKTYKVIPV